MKGTVTIDRIRSQVVNDSYPLDVYLPAAHGRSESRLPALYVLDSLWRFDTVVSLVEELSLEVVVVGVGNINKRARDYVPENRCLPGGGGNEAFYEFLTTELFSYVETFYQTDPTNRTLLGHSFGGHFALFALFRDRVGARALSGIVAADASIWCTSNQLTDLADSVANAGLNLPYRVHVSMTHESTVALAPYIGRILEGRFSGLSLLASEFEGSHSSMVRPAYREGLLFVFGLLP